MPRLRRRWERITVLAAVLASIATWLVAAHAEGRVVLARDAAVLHASRPESGLAHVATLPDGAPDHRAAGPGLELYEDGEALGPGRTVHDAIRQKGGGRFSSWGGTLYFSTSDGTDPARNGRTYSVSWSKPLPGWLADAALGTRFWVLGGTAVFLLALAICALARHVRRRPRLRAVLVKVTVVIVATSVALGVCELWARSRIPFAEVRWPVRWVEDVGFLFEPNAKVRWTNYIDFAVEHRSNDLGFLDRCHEGPKPAGVRRVLVLGDSFVEAAQVDPSESIGRRIEALAAAAGMAIEAITMGISGAGTSDALAFYQRYGARFEPDLVVLLFGRNDFANNSVVLEAIRNGWDPDHPPRPFFVRSPEGGFQRVPTDPAWSTFRLDMAGVPSASFLASPLAGSRLYCLVAAARHHASGTVARAYTEVCAARTERLRRREALAPLLEGWTCEDGDDLDMMFAVRDMPLAFREAEAITRHLLGALRAAVTTDGAEFVVLACHNVAVTVSEERPDLLARGALKRGVLQRLEATCVDQGIAWIDLDREFRRQGVLDDVEFAHDRHWNALGHASAAEALFEDVHRRLGWSSQR